MGSARYGPGISYGADNTVDVWSCRASWKQNQFGSLRMFRIPMGHRARNAERKTKKKNYECEPQRRAESPSSLVAALIDPVGLCERFAALENPSLLPRFQIGSLSRTGGFEESPRIESSRRALFALRSDCTGHSPRNREQRRHAWKKSFV
jgi:hypothetical protein